MIAIIAILAGMLLPGLARSKAQTKTILCINGLRQMSIATRLYAEDYGDRVPPAFGPSGEYWFHRLAPYMGEPTVKSKPQEKPSGLMRLMICPMTKRAKGNWPSDASLWGSSTTTWRRLQSEGSYGMNFWLDSQNELVDEFPPAQFYGKFSEAPADVPTYGDSVWVGSWPDGNDRAPDDFKGAGYGGSGFAHTRGQFMGRFALNRHSGGINICFTDGHAAKVNVKSLWSVNWHRDFEPNLNVKWPVQ